MKSIAPLSEAVFAKQGRRLRGENLPIRAKKQTSSLLEVVTAQYPSRQARCGWASVEAQNEVPSCETVGSRARGSERKTSQFMPRASAEEADTCRWVEVFRRDREAAISVAEALFVHISPIAIGNNLSHSHAARGLEGYHDDTVGGLQIDSPAADMTPGVSVDITSVSQCSVGPISVDGIFSNATFIFWGGPTYRSMI